MGTNSTAKVFTMWANLKHHPKLLYTKPITPTTWYVTFTALVLTATTAVMSMDGRL